MKESWVYSPSEVYTRLCALYNNINVIAPRVFLQKLNDPGSFGFLVVCLNDFDGFKTSEYSMLISSDVLVKALLVCSCVVGGENAIDMVVSIVHQQKWFVPRPPRVA